MSSQNQHTTTRLAHLGRQVLADRIRLRVEASAVLVHGTACSAPDIEEGDAQGVEVSHHVRDQN